LNSGNKKMLKKLLFSGPVLVLSLLILISTAPFAFVWRFKAGKQPRDTSWEFGRELIYSQGNHYWQEILKDFRIEISGNDFLEVGSGNGQWLIALDGLGAKKIAGVEPGDEILKYSLERLKALNLDNRIEVQKGVAESLPYADSCFDCVLCLGVFMFTQQDKALAEFNRVLKPGGQVLLTVNGLGYFLMKAKDGALFGRLNEIRYGVSGVYSTLIKWIFGIKIHASAVNTNEMKSILGKQGFELQRVWLHNDIDLYSLEHFGFPTNYAFRGKKQI